MKPNQSCGTCLFSVIEPTDLKKGTCRFDPPKHVMLPMANGQVINLTGYPSVTMSDRGCGKHENKIFA